jgi:2-desacetyl-2-hydroxyethyl bacteriochlorophyllide A dehydrogenase
MNTDKQTMLAARYLAPNRIEPVEVPIVPIGADDALIKVRACGFCGSDIGIISGVHPRARPPLTVGHEFCGVIAALGSAQSGIGLGDPVTVYPLISCGICSACRNDYPHVCSKLRLYGFDAEGAMAEYIRVPISSLIPLPPDMPPETGALIEPLAVAVHAVSRATWAVDTTAVVIGAGPIGLLTGLVAKARGVPQVLITDILHSRLQLAHEVGLVAVHTDELSGIVAELTDGEGVDLVFECAGASGSARDMTAITRPRGTIVNVSVFKQPVPVDLQAVNFKELTLLGSRVYTRNDFAEAVRLASGLPLKKLITHRFPLHEAATAYARFKSGEGVCKVLVFPDGVQGAF